MKRRGFMDIVMVADCIRVNIPKAEATGMLLAGYTTGSSSIRWNTSDWENHPNALRIDQDFQALDANADYLDVEHGAATIAECPDWYRRALRNYHNAERPGQRHPGFYISLSQTTELANKFVSSGIRSGPRLVIADWDWTKTEAISHVMHSEWPFPVVGVQFKNAGDFDVNVFSGDYVRTRSGHSGPHVHETDGTKTLLELATSRRMHVAGWMQLQRHLGGNATSDALGRATPPRGTKWLSQNP
jgi:hypothetical protein